MVSSPCSSSWRTGAAAGPGGEVTFAVQVRLAEQAVQHGPCRRSGRPAAADLGVVQVERRPLGADPRDASRSCAAAAGRRWPTPARRRSPTGRRSRPAARCARSSRRCRGTAASTAPSRNAPARGDLVHPGEAVLGQVVGVAPRHALHAEPVLDQEGGVEADEQHPEVDLAQRLVEHPAGELGPPEVEAGEHREHHGAEHDVVEVRDDEVGVGQVEVQRRAGQDDAGQAAEQERDQEADRPQHRASRR